VALPEVVGDPEDDSAGAAHPDTVRTSVTTAIRATCGGESRTPAAYRLPVTKPA
jgi:hypothetical protein